VNRKDIILLPILNKGIIAIGSDALSNAKVSYSLSGAKVTFLDMVKNDHLATILLFIIFLILLMAIILLTKNDRRLAEARKAADEANIAKSGFLSRMSHEIRTPMNAVVGLTILARQQEDDRQKLDEYLAKVQNSSKVLLSLINDVLDMSAIESGKLKIASQKFNLRMVLNGIDSIYRTQCQDKGVDFTMNIDLPQDEYVGDSLRINQILLNLVSNAFKFTEKGESIAVTVSQIRSSEETAYLSFIVSDTGCGMNKELLERLFKPFEQAGAETAMKHGGSGLGLSITKNLVTMMDGTIDVDSAPGMGSTFKVNLTLKNCEQDSYVEMPGTAIMDTSQQIHYDFTGHKVLIAEDNEINAEVAGGLLAQVNMDADYAENGQRALELFKSSAPGAYDAILMDVQMPVMNGYETTRAIRDLGRPDAETICIFALTAGAFTEDIDNALKSGMNDHIAKPIEPEELYSKLQSVIDHEKQ
jgi:signal transduction histidine kinase/ActR/RegA family two-component response regulator